MPVPVPGGVTLIDHPLVRSKMTEIRDARTPPALFRARLSEVATLLAFAVTQDLSVDPLEVQTPLAPHLGCRLARPLVLAPILRAGLGMMDGILKVLPEASVAHIGLLRDEQTHCAVSYYFKAPAGLEDSDVIVADPMLATGGSASSAIRQLKDSGARSMRFVCLVSCPSGIAFLQQSHPEVAIFTAAIDPHLNALAYIVPGLGDAGDRYFGTVGEKTIPGR